MGPGSRLSPSICGPQNVGNVSHLHFLGWLPSAGRRGQCPELTGGGVAPVPSPAHERRQQDQVPPRLPLCPAAAGDPALAQEHGGCWPFLVFLRSTAGVGFSLPRAQSGRTTALKAKGAFFLTTKRFTPTL